MSKKTTQLPIFIFIWLIMIGGIFWWWQGRDKEKETIEIEVKEKPSLFKESGPAAVGEIEPLKETSSLSDERKMADLDQIRAAVEMYYLEHNKYPISFKSLMPDYFSTDFVFQDKYWIDNRSDTQKYCLWLKLKTDKYFIGSPYGTAKIDHRPSGLDECRELSK